MALMDELSARLHRQDGASFNEEVLPLCCRYSSTQLLTLAKGPKLDPNPNPHANPSQVLPLRQGDRRAQARGQYVTASDA